MDKHLDRALDELNNNKLRWAKEITPKRQLEMLIRLHQRTAEFADLWIAGDLKSRQRDSNSWDTISSLLPGPAMTLRLLASYIKSFEALSRGEKPDAYKKLGKTTLQVFPMNAQESLIFKGYLGELVFEPELSEENILENQAKLYFQNSHSGKISLVLGVGNYSALTIHDALHKLFNDREVVMIKLHPLKDYIGNIIENIFDEFIEEGFLRFCYDGNGVGQYLTHHPLINDVHITGSDKTFEAIVFQSEDHQVLKKPVVGELGNVSPVIIIPGPWSKSDIAYQAEQIASGMTWNTGFSCNATRVLITQSDWPQRDALILAIINVLKATPRDASYYPGSRERIKEMIKHYPQAKIIGDFDHDKTPWVFVTDVDSSQKEEPCFKTEVFGSFISETSISAESTAEFIEKAVEFCNDTLWGTLNATLIIHPKLMQDAQLRITIERAIDKLNYGTVCINTWAGFSYYLGVLPWGGAPGSTPNNIQSGNGWVHNPLMFAGIQKSVLRVPFRQALKPPFPTNPKAKNIAAKILEFEKQPGWLQLLKILIASIF